MADFRIHRYVVAAADVEELRARRATLIEAIRADFPGRVETRLVRLETRLVRLEDRAAELRGNR